jgi:hypothetical protein
LDEVNHFDATVLVATGPVDDETEVGGNHLLLGFFITSSDALGEINLLFVGRHGVVVKVTQQEAETVVYIYRTSLLDCHSSILSGLPACSLGTQPPAWVPPNSCFRTYHPVTPR